MKLFITGTDTGVGKTVVAAALAKSAADSGRSVCIYKPVQTGASDCDRPDDPVQVQRWLDGLPLATHCSYCFSTPAAPWIADAEALIDPSRLVLDFKRLSRQYQDGVLLVEGAGGVRVPVTAEMDMIDLMTLYHVPVLVVARPDLGTINHTLLTVDALLHRDVTLAGVVVSGMPRSSDDVAVQTLERVFSHRLGGHFLGSLPQTEVSRAALPDATALLARLSGA